MPASLCRRLLLSGLWLLALSLPACREAPAPRPAAQAASHVPSPDAGPTPRYARGFTIEQRDGYRLVRVLTPWQDADVAFRYALVPRGSTPPAGLGDIPVIETPVRSIVALSTTHVGMLEALGLSDRIVGVLETEHLYAPSIRRRIEAGAVQDVGEFGNLNLERLLALDPDLVMVSSVGAAEYGAYAQLAALGLNVLVNAEYVEATPLGRAEWLLFVAALFDREAEAARLFDEVAGRYEALAAQARRARKRPTVFTGSSWRGTWYVAGGQSYVAHLLADAGADYLWSASDTQVSIPLDVEAVFERAAGADYWLHPGLWHTLEEGAAGDERYAAFEAFQEGRVYNNNRRMSPGGGNDFWESGVARPHVILADLLRIFHPDLLPGHALVYYQRLPRTASPTGTFGR